MAGCEIDQLSSWDSYEPLGIVGLSWEESIEINRNHQRIYERRIYHPQYVLVVLL